MDPNATLVLWRDADTTDEATEHAQNLIDWLNRGGFAPTDHELWTNFVLWAGIESLEGRLTGFLEVN
jgi:hypothetical protein